MFEWRNENCHQKKKIIMNGAFDILGFKVHQIDHNINYVASMVTFHWKLSPTFSNTFVAWYANGYGFVNSMPIRAHLRAYKVKWAWIIRSVVSRAMVMARWIANRFLNNKERMYGSFTSRTVHASSWFSHTHTRTSHFGWRIRIRSNQMNFSSSVDVNSFFL